MRSQFALLVMIGCGLAPPRASADDAPADVASDRARADEFLQLARRDAKAIEIAPVDDQGQPFTLLADPVLRWTNPTGGSVYGGLFLWTDRGCPRAATAPLKWYSPFTHTAFEFHSLCQRPLTAHYNGRPLWKTTAPGIAWKPVPGAPPPAPTPARRLIEMRALARQFTAEKTDREGERRKLRLLAQPVYRFQSEIPAVIDGALFVLAQGTDPEVLLLIRAHRTGDGARWEFAPARMNSVQLQLHHDDAVVWTVPLLPWRTVADHTQVYTSFRRDADGEELR